MVIPECTSPFDLEILWTAEDLLKELEVSGGRGRGTLIPHHGQESSLTIRRVCHNLQTTVRQPHMVLPSNLQKRVDGGWSLCGILVSFLPLKTYSKTLVSHTSLSRVTAHTNQANFDSRL